MIVTKALAKIYLIKRAAWFIETGPKGELTMAYRSVNWLEGMELWEDQDECLRELNKRQDARMASGHCPMCNYRTATETEKDLSYLTLIGEPKGSKLYQCPECRSLWFTKKGWKVSKGYDSSLYDYIIEWGNRPMQLNASQRKMLTDIGNISFEKSFELYPAHVVLKDGTEIPTAMVRLQAEPPEPAWFEKRGWHYLDIVKEMRPSEIAYPYRIAHEIMKKLYKGHLQMMYVKDRATDKIYSFECHAGVFLPEELKGKDLEFYKGGSVEGSFNYFEPHDRGGPDYWRMTPPPKMVTIWGDLL